MCVFQTQKRFSWKEASIQPQAMISESIWSSTLIFDRQRDFQESDILAAVTEAGNLQPQLYRVHPPTGTEVLARNLQTRAFFRSGLRVYICNFVILRSLLRKQSLSPYNFCECITECFSRKGWGGQANWHGTAQQAICCFQSKNRQSPVFS